MDDEKHLVESTRPGGCLKRSVFRRFCSGSAALVGVAALAGCSALDQHLHLVPEVPQASATSSRGTVLLSLLEDGFDHGEDVNAVHAENGLRVGIVRSGYNSPLADVWTADNARGVITDALAQSLSNEGFKVEPSVQSVDSVIQVRGKVLELMVENTGFYSVDAVCAIEITVFDGQRAARRKFRGYIDDSYFWVVPTASDREKLLGRAIAKTVEEAARGVAEFAGDRG